MQTKAYANNNLICPELKGHHRLKAKIDTGAGPSTVDAKGQGLTEGCYPPH